MELSNEFQAGNKIPNWKKNSIRKPETVPIYGNVALGFAIHQVNCHFAY